MEIYIVGLLVIIFFNYKINTIMADVVSDIIAEIKLDRATVAHIKAGVEKILAKLPDTDGIPAAGVAALKAELAGLTSELGATDAEIPADAPVVLDPVPGD